MNKVIIITGTSSGIGKAFIEIGPSALPHYTFIALTRSTDIESLHSNVEIIKTDTTNTKILPAVIESIIKKYGRIDVLINNVGNGIRGTIEDTSLEEIQNQMSVNVWPTVELIRLVSPIMRKQKNGHIINLSSLSAIIDYPTIGYYGASKAFIEKVTRTLAIELKPWNINVSLVIPGAVKTNFGRSMKNVQSYTESPYSSLYAEWGVKFAAMFRKPTTSEQAAQKIIDLVLKPEDTTFFRFKDLYYHTIRRLFGARMFTKYFIEKHMRG